jgi:hypothetical protein
MTKKKTHTRAPGMGQTSITVPDDLLKRVGAIASKETLGGSSVS